MKKIIILAAVFLPAISAWCGDLTTDNLTVMTNATIYGNLNFYTVTGTSNGATASGGDITMSGGYRIHTFTNIGTSIFEVVGGSLTCEVLVVAGGGGGGGHRGSGGGGGGCRYVANLMVAAGETTIIVGKGGGGSGVNIVGTNGNNSAFGTYTATGGGGGAAWGGAAGNGGSGGGGSAEFTNGGTGISGQGYAGGNGVNWTGGGGGGWGGKGGNAIDGTTSGYGGTGAVCSISGTATYYGGGGGGGTPGGTGGGAGSLGGGGHGGYSTSGENGTNNLGGGGGGGGNNSVGGNGGSGIVLIRYSTNQIIAVYSSTLKISSNEISQTSPSGTNVFMGKVGIGTDNPAEKLHVAGNVQVDGSLSLGGSSRTNWPSGADGALMISNNLSEITGEANKAYARDNLGLRSAATNEASVFLTPTSDGSQLTNITAVQVGALSTNAGALIEANNLSEISDTAATARTNLGLGSAATSDTSAFDPAGAATTVSNTLSTHTAATSNPHQVTAAQVGALAPTGNGAQLTNITAAQVGALSVTGGVVNGSLSVSSNLSQVSATDSNVFMGKVGIGTNNPAEKLHVAGNVQIDGTSIVSALTLGGETKTSWSNVTAGLLTSANNLSDVNASAARTNLGLGSAATSDTSAFDPAGAASAVSNVLSAHTAATNNPHQVTAAQVGALTPNGDGSQLTGITAAQVGALTPTGNGAQLTNITAAQVGALSVTGGVVNGTLSVTSNLFVNGTNVADLIGSGAFNPATTNLDMATNRIVNLALPVEQTDAASKYYLWTSLSNIPPMGNLSMGVYTNQ